MMAHRFEVVGHARRVLQRPIVPLLVLSAWWLTPAHAQTPDVEGRQIFETYCSTCHREGGAPRAPLPATLKLFSPERIVQALTNGLMAPQGAALTAQQRSAVASFVGTGHAQMRETLCANDVPKPAPENGTRISGWGFDQHNLRFIPKEHSGLSAQQLPSLKLRWAMVFPGELTMRAQATVAGNVLYLGSSGGTVYALDAASGCVHWKYQATAAVRGALNIVTVGAKAAKREVAYFADYFANVYALDAKSGDLLWRINATDDAHSHVTATPTFSEGRLYVALSSHEPEVPGVVCCSESGSVVAIDATNGRRLWATPTVPERGTRSRKNTNGRLFKGPSGASVWSSPTVDSKRGLVFVGTGPNKSSPATETSDAILALQTRSGRIKWVRQTYVGDAFTFPCWFGPAEDCPLEWGPDLDFGAPPILTKTSSGKDILIAGQKSGRVFGLDPSTGRILWQTGVGRGGASGGVHWGMTVIGQTLYVPISDRDDPNDPYDGGPGRPGMYALNVDDGEYIWRAPLANRCGTRKPCDPGISAPPTATDGLLFAGSLDGLLRAYDPTNGAVLWEYDTTQAVSDLAGQTGRGGAMDSVGVVLANGMLYVSSGYAALGQMPGNVFLAFSSDQQ
jgi:polyvinyl alcohol dehydrogenase (cytochrome)